MEPEIVFRLPVSQVNLLLSLLGNAPNASHSYPLMMAIKGQGDAQMAAANAPPAAAPAEPTQEP